jgi:hypothetical protein
MHTNTIGKIREKTDTGLYENMKTFQRKKYQNILNIPKTKGNKNIKHKTQNSQS